ncbi:MAG: glycosyltransferase family 4 protein [Anaerolineales bacterium]|nr:glycosyltransferase family 4 protein [Anaerolineales bacterium]
MKRDRDTRILILTNYLPPYRVKLLRELQKEVKVRSLLSTAMEANRNWEVDWKDLDVRLQLTLTLPQRWRHPIGFSEKWFLHIPLDTGRLVREYDPHAVVSAELGARTLGACFAAHRAKVPFIIWAKLSDHTEKGWGRVRFYLRRYILSRADSVLVNGEAGRRYLRQYNFPEERMFTVPYSVDLSSYSPIEDLSPVVPGRILLVSALQERKGIIPFLETAIRWCERNPDRYLEMSFIGTGPLRTSIEQHPRPANLQIRMPGVLAFEEMPSVYSQADLLAFPTLADEWGQVVSESLASGRPVLGSLYSQAVEELIIEGENGWVFHPDFPGEMEAALSRALAVSPETLQRMGRKARETASKVGIHVVANRFLEAVDWCLNESC